ncbi:hypothetical protein [Actinoplanes sp. NPDC049118]|uniref:hypothetical protein n=1 Tax=Actinoplanes sp. NPDC049118 TaxID=3155769 RepID=UPI0033C265CB
MTGDAPQPGETPRNEGDPWSYADPEAAWWRGKNEGPPAERPRHLRPRSAPAGTPALDSPGTAEPGGEPAEPGQAAAQDVATVLVDEPAEARRAGAQDASAALSAGPPPAGADVHPAPGTAQAPETPAREDKPETGTKGVEQHHDDLDAERFNTEGEGTVYTARSGSRPDRAGPEREPTMIDLLAAVPLEEPQPAQEVMILPEPGRDRPTVALDRGAVPGQPPSGLSRLGQAREDRARADRALQDRVRQERASALLETSPFWRAGEDNRAADLPQLENLERPPNAGRSSRRGARHPRRPAAGLIGLLALGLVASFFAWVSAEPFWLAVGHGDRGTATVLRCTGSGVTQRCTGQFTAADGAYRVDDLPLLGVEPERRASGSVARARMVSSESRQAYVGDTGMLVHLRWGLSFVLLLVCGLGIAGLTGARRLDTARARRGALLFSVAAPLVLLAGFLAVTY